MNSFSIYGNIVTEDRILENHFLHVQDGVIHAITPWEMEKKREIFDARDAFVLPGFRDQHIHDLQGQLAAKDQSLAEIADRIQQVCLALARQGVTDVYIATFGAPVQDLEWYCRGAYQWMQHPEQGISGARLEGIHIEGSFINEACRGAQPAEFCLNPTRIDCIIALNRLYATGAVRIANIVPDFGPTSLELIRQARNLGILVGAGHTQCSAELLRRAVKESDLQFLVHYTNGPISQSFKPFGGGGAFEGGLNLPIAKELILDRVHVDERYLMDILKQTEDRWGTDRIIAVTDGVFPLRDSLPLDEFAIGSTIACITEDKKYVRTKAYLQADHSRIPAPPNTLSGGLLTMDKAFENLINLFSHNLQGHWFDHPSMPWEKSIIKAARLCAGNQAKLANEYAKTGSLETGKWANITVGRLTQSQAEYEFKIERVFIRGVPIDLEM